MTQPAHSAPRGPRRRSDSTRPPATRRGGDRRPYPTASTTTRVSPAKPGLADATARKRGSKSTPTPATVWTAGPVPIDLDAVWPTPILGTIVTSLSSPGGHVVLLPWPTTRTRPHPATVGTDGAIDPAPGTEADAELADALAVVEELDRAGSVVGVTVDPAVTGPASQPFWADLVGGPSPAPVTVRQPSPPNGDAGVLGAVPIEATQADLIITSLRPEHSGDRASDLVALLAARLLRVGGILAVLTHCDWTRGELVDPSGPVVASAQNADLLYLQHIVALHTPVRDGQFAADSDGPAAEEHVRARHRTEVRGLPSPHRRIHSDVLVFAQPHGHEPPAPALATAAFESGVIR
ncbi:hypothetical protein F0L68_11605 [Solihabitans fulvus]|uniref:Uncharacterized protein n=1 Tax=Solihabitans fulvus TaxID=1892852 RepID=A0A5B2XG95_9PSEU|nr:hypothetical protein [Solihabitans fulvus]KAA2262858.1 hypothetical protein F0L68_11605 [Solihabitans fulvus]